MLYPTELLSPLQPDYSTLIIDYLQVSLFFERILFAECSVDAVCSLKLNA